ncbi:hypothetical protein Tco_0102240, partial [Tanacetum coccineum]
VYSLKRGRKDKDKNEDPSAGSDRGLKKRKISKYAEPTIGQKKKDSTSGTSKGTKSQLKSSGKSSNSQLNDKGFVDSGCSRHMTGNITHLLDFKDSDGGYVTFGRGGIPPF